MKITAIIVLLGFGAVAWAQDAEKLTQKQVAQALLKSFGLDKWDQIEAIRFTFNVSKEDKRVFRTWTWHPKAGKVIYSGPLGDQDLVEVTYNRNKLDAKTPKRIKSVDAMFINDSFWLLLPLHLSWSKDVKLKYNSFQPTPIGHNLAREVVVTYPKTGGGYTPGDMYKLYVDDDWRIVQWAYHKAGAKDAAVKSIWMFDEQVGPLRLTTDFHWSDAKFRLWFTTLAVKTTKSKDWIKSEKIDHNCRTCG